jgi:nitrate/nitrite-specific signal transduction histidine kinase
VWYESTCLAYVSQCTRTSNGRYLLSRLVAQTTIVTLAACKDVSGEALAVEQAGGWRFGATRLAVQGGFQQWPTSTNPMAVASID